ncbi:MAG TPA: LysR family transcriptional regulator [Rhodanobacteraceae bacterium]
MPNAAQARTPRVTLEQWRALRAVVDAGGYAQAAAALHKSQSAVTYSVQKLQHTLGVKVFELKGRKATLTAVGQLLYRRAGALLEEAGALEGSAGRLAQGWESELRIAIDTVFPTWLLLQCLGRFAAEQPAIRIELFETVLGGTEQALSERRVDLAIGPVIPPGFLGDPLLRLHFVAVAAPGHPLHRIHRALTYADLRRYRQLVIRDSGPARKRDAGWLGAEQRWTVSHKATSIRAACMGEGFAWYPEDMIRDELASGALRPLKLREGGERYAELYLAFADRDGAGPGLVRLAELLRDGVHTAAPQTSNASRSAARSAGSARKGSG